MHHLDILQTGALLNQKGHRRVMAGIGVRHNREYRDIKHIGGA